MKDGTGLFVFLLTSLVGRTVGIDPNSGYCIGTQCFTVIQDRSDFTAAKDYCRDQGQGHLMTVRSSVSRDILSILLGTFTGRFWIGLHLPSGCPDSAAGLRGFRWVTGDNESDFVHWGSTFDGGCPAHRCVSVSTEDEFRWTQGPCGEPADGFLCEYTFSDPCTSLDGESVSYRTPMGFAGEELLSLPPGSTAVRGPAGTKHLCFSGRWFEAPWSCEIQEGGCEYKCAVDPNHEPSCYCPSGTSVNPANKVTCEVAPDDPCGPLRCAHACYKDGDSYACMCDHGFKLGPDGRSCVDLNECRDARQCPGDNFMCVNNVGGFQCVCESGFKTSGDLCVDVDECASAPCEHMCVNTPGSYRCSCYHGYKEDSESPDKCKLYCGDEECPAECDPNDRFLCYCPEGYISEERGDHTVCMDMDECSFSYCDQDCTNTYGSYVCACAPGYTLEGQFRCVKNEDDTDPTEDLDGSGAGTSPSIPTTSPPPHPEPTRRPSGVTVGGLVGIILCTVVFIVLLVFLAHHFLGGTGKMESKAPEAEGHGLHHVTSDA